MKKWMALFSPLLFMSSIVSAWGGRYVDPHSTTGSQDSLSTHFPLNYDQGWFVEESYLLMRPSLGAVDFGDMVMTKQPSNTEADFKIRVKEPDFEWGSGVRIGAGRYLPNHDKWDVSLYTTYIYGQAEEEFHGNIGALKALSASYSPFPVLSNDTDANWRLNYFVWDLMVGRQFSMTPRIIFHPYLGIRASLIYMDFKTRNEGNVTVTFGNQTFAGPGNAKISNEENFWGVGPRVGSNFDYKFSGSWSFLGNLAAAFLYGHYHVKEKTQAVVTTNGVVNPFNSRSLNHDEALRLNLEGAFGLGWEHWFQNNSIRLAPTVLFEGSLWFDMDNFFKPTIPFSQDRGNLGLMGLSFNLQVDF